MFRFENHGFIYATVIENHAPASGISLDTDDENPFNAQLPAFWQDRPEHLCGIPLSAFAGTYGVTDMTAVLFQKCIEMMSYLDDTDDFLVSFSDIDVLCHRNKTGRHRLGILKQLYLIQPILGSVKFPQRTAAVHGAFVLQKLLPELLDRLIIFHSRFYQFHLDTPSL